MLLPFIPMSGFTRTSALGQEGASVAANVPAASPSVSIQEYQWERLCSLMVCVFECVMPVEHAAVPRASPLTQ